MGFLNEITRFTDVRRKTGTLHSVPLSSRHYTVFHNVICNWCNRVVQFLGIIIFTCPLQPFLAAPRHRETLLSRILWIFERKVLQTPVRGRHPLSTDFPGATSLSSHETKSKSQTHVPIGPNCHGCCYTPNAEDQYWSYRASVAEPLVRLAT